MEWPVGWREGWDGGCGRKPVPCGGGTDSALWSFFTSPAWWSSRRLLACQLKTGPQTRLKVLPGPGAAIFPSCSSSRAILIPGLLLCSQIKGSPTFPSDLRESVVMS